MPKGGLELLGASTKGEQHIGQFGSGIKYVVVQALREKIALIIQSRDWACSFSTVKAKVGHRTFEQVQYNYESINGTTELRPSSYTTEAAQAWSQPWYILREFWANAVDAGSPSIRRVDSIEDPRPNWTDVYIEETKLIKEAYENITHWWNSDRKVISTCEAGSLLEKDCCPGMHVYLKGMLITHAPSKESLWDYDFSEVRELNEVRELGNLYIIKENIRKVLETSTLEVRARALKEIIKDEKRGYSKRKDWAENDISWYSAERKSWAEALQSIYKNPVINDGKLPTAGLDLVRQQGYEVVDVSDDLRSLLANAFERPGEVLAKADLKSLPLEPLEAQRLKQIDRILSHLDLPTIPISVQEVDDGAPGTSIVFDGERKPFCLILKRSLLKDSGVPALLALLKTRALYQYKAHEHGRKIDDLARIAVASLIEAYHLREGEIIG
jgi:hypothetical protein